MHRMFVVALVASAFAAAAAAQQPPLPPAVGNAVLLATSSIRVDRTVVVTRGDLVVNDAGGTLALDQSVKTPAGFALEADSVSIGTGDIIGGDVSSNQLHNNGTINGARSTPLPLPVIATLPALPDLQASGTQDVTIPDGATQPLGTGVYGNLHIGRDATLHIPGGPYVFASISTDRGASIVWDGPGEIVVNGSITLGQSNTIAAMPGVTTKHKMMFARGSVTIGKSSTIGATIFAPDGTIDADQSLALTGSFVARDIHISQGSTLTLRSGFRNLPPVANDQTVTVVNVAVVITLTGSDPDLDPLHFEIGIPPSNGTLSPVVQASPTSATAIYTPNMPNPEDTFTFRVVDSEGFVASGVVKINAGITLPPPPNTILAHATTVDVQQNVPSNIPLGAIGPPGVAITLSIVPDGGPFHGTLGPLQQPSLDPPHPGSIVYVPQQGFAGEDSFLFRACGVIGGAEVCDVARISIAVHGKEVGELAPDQTVSTDSGSPTPILLTSGAPPTAIFRIVRLPANGTLTDSSGAAITQTPYALPSAVVTYQSAAGFSGADTFAFEVVNGTQSDTGTVTVNVTAVDNGR